jgi:hypothetical protein
MLAFADFVESATLVAVTMAVVFDVTAGAVYRPLADIVPFEVVQITAVFQARLTEA